jgi:hypothetical protein
MTSTDDVIGTCSVEDPRKLALDLGLPLLDQRRPQPVVGGYQHQGHDHAGDTVDFANARGALNDPVDIVGADPLRRAIPVSVLKRS